MNVLVTGGGGYIGSHAVKRLIQSNHKVVVLDSLFRGHSKALPDSITLEKIDLSNTAALTTALIKHKIDCVMHFAALAFVGESVTEPLKYYQNNTGGTVSLLKAMDKAQVKQMVFSSTCATYGLPASVPITEDMPQSPINPYGWSKLFIEQILKDYALANKDFSFAALRYFNVAGCAEDGTLGEDHDPETHLIPVILETALGKRKTIKIFGDDYDTIDGTCIRDYIHVEDLVDAHEVVMEALKPGQQRFYNLGIGKGLSVKQIIDAACQVTGQKIPFEVAPRRPGDPPKLYANAEKIKNELGWQAKYTDINKIVETAWKWMKRNPNGYEG